MKIRDSLFLIVGMLAVTLMQAQAAFAASTVEANQQRASCLKALDHYFSLEVPVEQLRMYLNAQFEVTAYRLLASMLAQREEQQKDYREGNRREKAIPRYSLQVKEHVEALEKEVGDDPQFIEGKHSFAKDALSISTLAKLAPFIDRHLVRHSRIYDNGSNTANFRLDDADFKMLNFLAAIEEKRTGPRPGSTLVNHIENFDQEFLEEMEHHVNLVVVDRYSIQPAQGAVEDFWTGLKMPQECTEDVSFYSVRQRTGAVTQVLHDSMLKREDMKISRDERSHIYVFHTGRSSPYRWAEDADVYDETPVPEEGALD